MASKGKFFVRSKETTGPEDWKEGLADPDKHWKWGKSAKALAYCWEEAGAFPPEVQRVFEKSGFRQLKGLRFVEGLVEHTTSVPGRGRASQTDILVQGIGQAGAVAVGVEGLVEHTTSVPGRGRASQTDILVQGIGQAGAVAVGVEGKVDENFDEVVSIWLGPRPSTNRQTRLAGLCHMLGVPGSLVGHIRYQLIHRTAAVLIEANNMGASVAVMLVHSFNQVDRNEHFDDYRRFVKLLGKNSSRNSVVHAGKKNGIDLYLAWVRGDKRFLAPPRWGVSTHA